VVVSGTGIQTRSLFAPSGGRAILPTYSMAKVREPLERMKLGSTGCWLICALAWRAATKLTRQLTKIDWFILMAWFGLKVSSEQNRSKNTRLGNGRDVSQENSAAEGLFSL
jgi:hypothetical protein